ncbi:carbohydrate-selective porin OprB [Bradyrhizobium japonicum]
MIHSCDRYGVNFRANDPPLALYEAQLQWNAKKGVAGLDGKLKLGGWRLGSFTDLRFDKAGPPLADPASSGTAGGHSGDYGLYAVFEQKLYRIGNDDDRGIGVFARASFGPSDRNPIHVYADGGREVIGVRRAPARQVRHRSRLCPRVAPRTDP